MKRPIRAEEYARAYLSKHRMLQLDVFDMRAMAQIDHLPSKTERRMERRKNFSSD
jgi:hypothetical protein